MRRRISVQCRVVSPSIVVVVVVVGAVVVVVVDSSSSHDCSAVERPPGIVQYAFRNRCTVDVVAVVVAGTVSVLSV